MQPLISHLVADDSSLSLSDLFCFSLKPGFSYEHERINIQGVSLSLGLLYSLTYSFFCEWTDRDRHFRGQITSMCEWRQPWISKNSVLIPLLLEVWTKSSPTYLCTLLNTVHADSDVNSSTFSKHCLKIRLKTETFPEKKLTWWHPLRCLAS